MLEWRRLAANRKVHRMAASIPSTAPVVHFTPSRSRYKFILLGEQRHMCVNNLPRVAPSGGTAGNRTRNLSITNPTPCRYTTKRHASSMKEVQEMLQFDFSFAPAIQFPMPPSFTSTCDNSHTLNTPLFKVIFQVPPRYSEGPLFRRSSIPKVRCVWGYNCLRFMDRLGSGGIVGCLGFRVSASYRYITSFSKLIHKLRHTSFRIVDLRNSGPSD